MRMPWDKKNESFDVLAGILSSDAMRDELLSRPPVQKTNDRQIIIDANSVIQYAKTDGYSVWAKEAWAQVLADMKTVLSPKATGAEVEMARGSLRATLDLLGVAAKAQEAKNALEQKSQVPTRASVRA